MMGRILYTFIFLCRFLCISPNDIKIVLFMRGINSWLIKNLK